MSQQTTDQVRSIRVGKVVLNIGVGKSGEAIQRGKRVLEDLTGQKAAQRRAKKTIRDFGTHKGEPIGIVVTIRGERTGELIKRLLATRDNKLNPSSFDKNGSISFGVKEHIEIPGVKYDPEIGIFGMNVSVLLERPGYRVARRMRRTSLVGKTQRVSGEEAQGFFRENFGAIIE
jgi:large subunit ribosomal protein L5